MKELGIHLVRKSKLHPLRKSYLRPCVEELATPLEGEEERRELRIKDLLLICTIENINKIWKETPPPIPTSPTHLKPYNIILLTSHSSFLTPQLVLIPSNHYHPRHPSSSFPHSQLL
jgi:hypothetical protein